MLGEHISLPYLRTYGQGKIFPIPVGRIIKIPKEEARPLLEKGFIAPVKQDTDSIWQETNSLFQATLSRVEKCYIPGAIEKALRKDEVCSAFEILDRVWKDVLKGKEDIASFERALKQWEVILLSNLKEFV